MKYLVSIFEWGEQRELESPLELKENDTVVIELGFGKHLGKIVEACGKECEKDDKNKGEESNISGEGFILRKATVSERKKSELSPKKKDGFVRKCRELVKKYKLPMKLVGVDMSIEGGGIIFGFTAEERIDFRSLVRELASTFQKSVRLQQIGSRDEARLKGGIGPCGRRLCCLSKNITMQSISTEMARLQQISHRGNERLSGCCNRLMCCLAFEQATYEKLRSNLPDIGARVKTPSGIGTVENLKILSQEVGVRLDSDSDHIIWVKVKEIK